MDRGLAAGRGHVSAGGGGGGIVRDSAVGRSRCSSGNSPGCVVPADRRWHTGTRPVTRYLLAGQVVATATTEVVCLLAR